MGESEETKEEYKDFETARHRGTKRRYTKEHKQTDG
jgi:hypothetical protein